MQNKRGETIVEVVTSMAILAIVLSALYNVVIGVASISLTSRDQTKATAMAQKGLANYERIIFDACSSSLGSTSDVLVVPGTESPANCQTNGNYDQPCNFIEVKNTITGTDATTLGLDVGAFSKIISHVKWRDKARNIQEITVIEIVRKSGNN